MEQQKSQKLKSINNNKQINMNNSSNHSSILTENNNDISKLNSDG